MPSTHSKMWRRAHSPFSASQRCPRVLGMRVLGRGLCHRTADGWGADGWDNIGLGQLESPWPATSWPNTPWANAVKCRWLGTPLSHRASDISKIHDSDPRNVTKMLQNCSMFVLLFAALLDKLAKTNLKNAQLQGSRRKGTGGFCAHHKEIEQIHCEKPHRA